MMRNRYARRAARICLIVAALFCLTESDAAAVKTTPQTAAKRNAPRPEAAQSLALTKLPGAKPRNVVFILSDDHRYDALGFMRRQPFIHTPHLDALARGGVHLENAFVTTALCSPSRASVLTGQYAHRHRVVDNDSPLPSGLIFFPQYLQQAGYETAFIGKWHMGGASDDPRPGFDHWVSFKGQGSYLPSANGLNVNGTRVPQKGYITDELTDYATAWLARRSADKPFFLYLSHKAVHAEFIPAERHRGRYRDEAFTPPKTMRPEAVSGAPMWVRNQRNSWHGVDFPYHSALDIEEYYKRYAETLLALDESVGRVMSHLKERGLLESTLVIYMGDNGFAFGEHGLIDKRTAYEESMRVPVLAHCPELFARGQKVTEVVANIDIAPTILEAAALNAPAHMDGTSFLGLAMNKQTSWRDALLYEYYWERAFPQTPTIHALRANQYKYIRYHGIWDVDELYDIRSDPLESQNLIASPQHHQIVMEMNRKLFETLEQTHGMYIQLYRDRGGQQNLRRPEIAGPAPFPSPLIQKPTSSPPPPIGAPRAFVDGAGPGWRPLGEEDFRDVNGRPETWVWRDGLVVSTGQPIGVLCTARTYTNFEMVAEWRHLQSAGNSGIFVWVPAEALKDLKPDELPRWGIEVQALDHGYTEQYEKRTGKKAEFFTTHGDIFPVGQSKMNVFAPTSPNGSRSFPRKQLSKGVNEWNHYYIRCINGEVRLWVNGEEVSGGNNSEPRIGFLCLEAEGSPIEFKNLRIRELP